MSNLIETMTLELPSKLSVEFSVDKCTHDKFNGTHQETFDLTKLTADDVAQYLAQTLIIRRQAQFRAKTALDNIKTIGSWIVPTPGRKIPITEEGIARTMKKAASLVSLLTEEQKAEIAKAMGFAYIPAGLPDPADSKLEDGEQLSDPAEAEETEETTED